MKLPLALLAVWLIATCLYALEGISRAATTPGATASGGGSQANVNLGTAAIDPLVITAEGDAANRLGQPIFIAIKIKNTAGSDLLMKNINVNIDGVSADRFKTVTCKLQQLGEIKISRGLSFEQTCRFEMKASSFSWTLKSWQDNLLAADVRLAVTADIEPLGAFKYYPSVRVNAPELSIFIGGIFGALLLAVFVWIERMLRNAEDRKAWFRDLRITLLTGLRGGIMAIIALLIGKTTQGAGAPVSLTVIDFTGGVMVGLFSYPLASWISSALKLESALQSGDKPAGKSDEDGA